MPTKRWPKLEDLARDLQVSARDVLQRFRDAGIPVQNRVTRLKPDQERLVREWFSDTPEEEPQDD